MARLTEIKLIDDLDGSKADESITFSLHGVSYEIDLSKRNAAKFRSSLEPYVAAAQKLSRTRAHRVSARRRSVGTGAARSDREQNQAIREWAQRKGLEVSARGRISRAVVEQYEAEAGR